MKNSKGTFLSTSKCINLLNSAITTWEKLTGEPQGSVLDPVLFNIINYLDECIEGELVKFAYDTKLGAIANTLDDKLKIQNELNNLSSLSISSLPFSLSDWLSYGLCLGFDVKDWSPTPSSYNWKSFGWAELVVFQTHSSQSWWGIAHLLPDVLSVGNVKLGLENPKYSQWHHPLSKQFISRFFSSLTGC